jgi:uncharacterized protein
MPQPDDAAPASRRDRRHARRDARRRARRRNIGLLVGGIAGAFVTAGAALAVTGVVELDRGSEPAAARTSPGGTTAPVVAGELEDRCRAPLSPDDPLRLWIGGDSLAGSLGPSLGEMTAGTGVVQPVFLSRVSSGLSSPEFFDWTERGLQEMYTVNPEVTVFIIGANDTSIVGGDEGQWRPQYEQRVEEMMTLLIGDDRSVYWIGAPIFEDRRSEKLQQLNRVFQEVAGRHPEVVYVDAYTLFTGPDGRYAESLPGADGETVQVRADDGVHFTPEGGDRLAGAVFEQLDPFCAITAQAVEGEAKQVIESRGSTRVPGTSRESSTTATTTGATATATTSAPATTAPPTTTVPPPSTAQAPPPSVPQPQGSDTP